MSYHSEDVFRCVGEDGIYEEGVVSIVRLGAVSGMGEVVTLNREHASAGAGIGVYP